MDLCVKAYIAMTELPARTRKTISTVPLILHHTHRLEILDAEDRLSIACEKGFTEDPTTLQVGGAWRNSLGFLSC